MKTGRRKRKDRGIWIIRATSFSVIFILAEQRELRFTFTSSKTV